MRDIRFRAWHAGNKDEHGAFYRGHEPKMLYDGNPGDCLRWLAERQNITDIMQFTGLHDKTGREVYEGDVCCIPESVYAEGKNSAVIFRDGGYRFDRGMMGARFLETALAGNLEVIGNIYENPDLLEPQRSNH